MDAGELDRVCAAYGLGAVECGAAGERVWRLRAAPGAFALKHFAAGEAGAARREALLLDALGTDADPRYRVPALRRTRAGGLWLDGADGCWLVTEWADGQFKAYDAITAAEWAALGASLAALHLRLERIDPAGWGTLGAWLRGLDLEAERRQIVEAGEQALRAWPRDVADLKRYTGERLALLEASGAAAVGGVPGDPHYLIHNDYNQYNYLFGAALPPLILDWEAAIAAPREFEVVRCLNHLPLRAPELAASFVAAYLRLRPLRAGAMAWAVDAALLQHALKHWPLRRSLDGEAGFEQHLRGAMALVHDLAGQRQRLAAFFHDCVDA